MSDPSTNLIPEEALRAVFQPLLPDEEAQVRRIRSRVQDIESEQAARRRSLDRRPPWLKAAAFLLIPKYALAKGLGTGTALGGKVVPQASTAFAGPPALILISFTALFGWLLQKIRRIPLDGSEGRNSLPRAFEIWETDNNVRLLLGGLVVVALWLLGPGLEIALAAYVGLGMFFTVLLLDHLAREGFTERAPVSMSLFQVGIHMSTMMWIATTLATRSGEAEVIGVSNSLLALGSFAWLIAGDPGRISAAVRWIRHPEDSLLVPDRITVFCLRGLRMGFAVVALPLFILWILHGLSPLIAPRELTPRDLREEVLALDVAGLSPHVAEDVLLCVQALRGRDPEALPGDLVEHLSALPVDEPRRGADPLTAHGLATGPGLPDVPRWRDSLGSPRMVGHELSGPSQVQAALSLARDGMLSDEEASVIRQRNNLSVELAVSGLEPITLVYQMFLLEGVLAGSAHPVDAKFADLLHQALLTRVDGMNTSEGTYAFSQYPLGNQARGSGGWGRFASQRLDRNQLRATLAALLIMRSVGVPEGVDLERIRDDVFDEIKRPVTAVLVDGPRTGVPRLLARALEHSLVTLPGLPERPSSLRLLERAPVIGILLLIILGFAAIHRAPREQEGFS